MKLKFCIQNLRSGRAAGEGGIAPEVLKAGGAEMVGWLHRMFSLVWAPGKVPQAWKDSIIIALYKGAGDQADCNKYRGISLLEVEGKILASILARRALRFVDDKLLESQCGFRPRRRTTDAMFAVRRSCELRWASGLDTYLCFIDLQKAFDSVDRPRLFRLCSLQNLSAL